MTGTDAAGTAQAGADSDVPARPSRRSRLKLAAAARGVPLATILVTVSVVAGVYLLGVLAYRLRNILLLILIAGFLALILNPFVVMLCNRGIKHRGTAVGIVVVVGAVVFLGLAAAFGYPLSNGVAHLAHQLPTTVSDAQHGRGVIGRLVQHFHLQKWVNSNAPKLQSLGANLAKPALSFGKGAVVVIGELLAVLTLVVLLLLEGPRMRKGILNMMSPDRAEWCQRVATKMRKAAVGYVFGDLLTSLIAGIVVGITMFVLGLPFPLLWAIWVALVDSYPR